MFITAIKQQQRDSERVSLYLDGKYAFSLTLSQLVSEKLKVGIAIDEQRLAGLIQSSQNEKLRLKAMNWTFLRPRSTYELRQYLKRQQRTKQLEASTDWIVDDFVKRSWVDDVQFAKWWVGRSSRKSKSQTALRSELAAKGIDREIISEVLEVGSDNSVLPELITSLRKKSRYQDDERLMRYLAGKGFHYSSIVEALALGDGES
jgi:regulatory protein